jgi:phenylacetate-coenzyme A ligase PaaK-like adenylate-forming protein
MNELKMSNYITDRERISSSFYQGTTEDKFDTLALLIFEFQYNHNQTYKRFCDLTNRKPGMVSKVGDIPFLPIQFFKTHVIKTGEWTEESVFSSSGTTGQIRSKHFIHDLSHYLENCVKGFLEFFDNPKDICFLAILPGYADRPDSSLIYMVNEFINISKYENSGFYLGKDAKMLDVLANNKANGIPTVLFGVSFALLDLCKYEIDFDELIVIETGGMKNSKIELTKNEILQQFRASWKINTLASEYGMTELLSQSYAINSQWYQPSSTKKVLIGSLSDPFSLAPTNKAGVIKVIDLANFDTCSFIETEDLGALNSNGQFQVLGRMDHAELRGCNLLLDQA